jgi:hypothetical protein
MLQATASYTFYLKIEFFLENFTALAHSLSYCYPNIYPYVLQFYTNSTNSYSHLTLIV